MKRSSFIGILLVSFFIASSLYVIFLVRSDVGTQESKKVFKIEEGESLQSISNRLEEDGFINSAFLFRVWLSVLGRDTRVQLGSYVFDSPMPLYGVISKLVFAKPDLPLISVTIPEGTTTYDIAVLMQKQLPNISLDVFGEAVSEKGVDGKLFPSTYHLLPSTTEKRIVEIMVETFEKKYSEVFSEVEIKSPLEDRDDVINLAALLEAEAKHKEDMQIISGILQKRMKEGMRLQADAAPETYDHAGLPYEIINNPGLDSMQAVLNPIETPYYYYITGNDGKMYYAKTFEEHKRNIDKYLR